MFVVVMEVAIQYLWKVPNNESWVLKALSALLYALQKDKNRKFLLKEFLLLFIGTMAIWIYPMLR